MVETRFSLPLPKIYLIIPIVFAFLSAQRILLENTNVYFCIFFLLASWFSFFKGQYGLRNSYLILALFVSVDIGLTYSSTPAFIRYVIYLTALFYLFGAKTLNLNSVKMFSLFLLVLSVKTITSLLLGLPFSLAHFFNDVLFVSLLFIVCCVDQTVLYKYSIDLNFLFFCLFGFLIGECVNSLYFNFVTHGYMSFDTTKALIVFPLLYAFNREGVFLKSFLLVITFYILLMYVTRMIALSTVLVLLLILFRRFDYKFLLITVSITLLGISFFSSILINFESYKVTGSFLSAYNADSIFSALQSLDPVRAAEQVALFSRNVFDILLGEGMGFGYFDNKNIFSFVNTGMAAFTEQELESRVFFNFHDFWSDIGYRLGVLVPLAIILYLIKSIKGSSPKIRAISCVLLVLCLCSFFSTPGLLVIAMFFLALRCEKSNSNVF